MADDLFGLDRDNLARVSEAVRWVEENGRNISPPAAAPIQQGTLLRSGKTYVAIVKGASGEVQFLQGPTKGSEPLSAGKYQAFSRYGDFEANKLVLLAYIDGGWEIIGGEC